MCIRQLLFGLSGHDSDEKASDKASKIREVDTAPESAWPYVLSLKVLDRPFLDIIFFDFSTPSFAASCASMKASSMVFPSCEEFFSDSQASMRASYMVLSPRSTFPLCWILDVLMAKYSARSESDST